MMLLPLKMEKKFCVIAPCNGPNSTIDRTWLVTADDAVAHATSLFKKYPTKAQELYVVQVVKIVRTPISYEVVDVV